MEQNGKKAGGGCLRGCLTLIIAAVVILFLLYQIGNYLDLSPGEEPADTTTPTTPTVTSTGAEEPTDKPQQPEEESPRPPLKEEEPIEPSTTDNVSIEFTETIKEAPQSNEFIERHFTWEYLGKWDWDVLIPEALYDYYHEMPRPPTKDYSVYVTHPLDDIYIERLVEIIKESAAQKEFNKYQIVEFTIAFVQSLPYTVDSVTSPFDEYPRYPVETLVDGGGDCEDTSILLASLLTEMGYGVVLISPPEHMAVGLKGGDNIRGTYWEYEGDKYFYIETTGSGRRIGELPEEYADTSAKIYPLVPVPIITHEWDLEGKEYYYELKVKVNNLGTAAASDVYVFACFDAGDGTGWSLKQSDMFDLEPGHQVTATLGLLPPPPGVRTRLMVRIVIGGYKVDESYSVWFDT